MLISLNGVFQVINVAGTPVTITQADLKPMVSDSLSAGVDLVSFSGDKLLGGPQAGILAGRQDLVARLRRNPMFRALRLDKLIYQALETTLRNLLLERWDQIPALRMISQSTQEAGTSHIDVLMQAERAKPRVCALLRGIVSALPEAGIV